MDVRMTLRLPEDAHERLTSLLGRGGVREHCQRVAPGQYERAIAVSTASDLGKARYRDGSGSPRALGPEGLVTSRSAVVAAQPGHQPQG